MGPKRPLAHIRSLRDNRRYRAAFACRNRSEIARPVCLTGSYSGATAGRNGPKRRIHSRDRAPGPLETGRRHGRPLHPWRIRRFGAQVSVTPPVPALRFGTVPAYRSKAKPPRYQAHMDPPCPPCSMDHLRWASLPALLCRLAQKVIHVLTLRDLVPRGTT